ncbi:DUF4238 domain-containing protein [Geothrix sp. 21YS21S-4]|uniref:DUF4238 domain-containing protein n=1 Tax=Geothrix sp. 21YS21S-4 TaxID=3068889 RepID=UPI0027BA1489|nr:DUF4238 domain-containing protein [Geothrix sp. 21YS21S-4]
MAGNKHHFLPRFLMKGFASRIEEKKVFVWLYRKNAAPREESTRNIGHEKGFYRTGQDTADPEITAAERPMVELVDHLRDLPTGSAADGMGVPEMVAHFVTRTRHIRDSVEALGDIALERFDDFLASGQDFMRMVLNSPKTKQQILAGTPAFLRPMAMQDFPSLLKRFEEECGPALQAMILDAMSQTRKRIPVLVKKTHVELLRRELAPEARVANYRKLSWSVIDVPSPMILGDVGVLFETGGTRRYKPYDEKGDLLMGAYLPITSQRLLVGLLPDRPPTSSPEEIRAAYARACREFFVGSAQSEELKQLQPLLGTESEMMSLDEVDRAFKEWMLEASADLAGNDALE